jgi:flagellar L-ring protein precursor FlgH
MNTLRPPSRGSVALRVVRAAVPIACALLATQGGVARAQSAAPPTTDSASTARPGRQSWTSGRGTFAVGDVVTVLIDERTLATARLTDNHADSRGRNLGIDASLPTTGGVPPAPIAGSVSMDQDNKSRRSGEATRNNAFIGAMSARVVAVSPSGALQISGRKLVTVDKSAQELVVTGWIRAQDVSPSTNSVPSARLADAEITYAQQGSLGKPKSSIIGRLLGAIWP